MNAGTENTFLLCQFNWQIKLQNEEAEVEMKRMQTIAQERRDFELALRLAKVSKDIDV